MTPTTTPTPTPSLVKTSLKCAFNIFEFPSFPSLFVLQNLQKFPEVLRNTSREMQGRFQDFEMGGESAPEKSGKRCEPHLLFSRSLYETRVAPNCKLNTNLEKIFKLSILL